MSSTLALAVLLTAAPAAAGDLWTAPYPGVRHLHRRAPRLDYHVITVDLANPRVEVVATQETQAAPRPGNVRYRWTRTSSWARAVGAAIAVNANYYDIRHRAMTTCGLAMGGGEPWRSAYADRRLGCWWSVGFGKGRAEVFDSHGAMLGAGLPPWMTEAVSGSPRVLEAGRLVPIHHPRHALARNPRTLVGLSADRKTLYLMVVNGREGLNQGMTCREAGAVLQDMGAWDAVNLDGGGSSSLWVGAEGGLVSRTPDGRERGVANHLGIVLRPRVAERYGPPEAPADPPVRVVEAPAPVKPAAPAAAGAARPYEHVVAAGGWRDGWGLAALGLVGAVSWGARRRSPRPPTRENRP